MSIKVVAITGGGGYLGSALARRLADQYQVRILDRVCPAFVVEDSRFSFQACDVTAPDQCRAALQGADAVFHRVGLMGNLASMKAPMDYYAVNYLGTLNVLEACVAHGVRRFIFDSTEAVYGRSLPGPMREEDLPTPNSVYGATKLACEAAIRMYDERRGLPTLVFRYSRTRDRRKEDAITILARRVLNGQPVKLYDGGRPMIDFVELEDLIEANVLALTSPRRNEVVNICTGEGISFADMLGAIERLAGRKAVAVSFEQLPSHPPLSEHKFGSDTFFMSIERAKANLGWTPRHDLETSIAGSIAALREGTP